jgi:hypothetical protein
LEQLFPQFLEGPKIGWSDVSMRAKHPHRQQVPSAVLEDVQNSHGLGDGRKGDPFAFRDVLSRAHFTALELKLPFHGPLKGEKPSDAMAHPPRFLGSAFSATVGVDAVLL